MIEIIQLLLILFVGIFLITGVVRYILQILKEYKEERFGVDDERDSDIPQ